MPRTGVLLTGFGGPDSLEAVGPFMCNLMGREPSAELVDRICERYLAIGGSSPLPEIAAGFAEKLERALAEMDVKIPVRVGMRYWDPYIGDAIAQLKDQGIERIVTVSLSPFESKVTAGAYREAIAEAIEELGGGIEVVESPPISELPAFIDYFAGSAAVALEELEPNEGVIIAFTAHSLPESDLTGGEDDPYVKGLRRIADGVAEALGLGLGHPGAGAPTLPGFQAFGSATAPRAWFLAFQSKGQKPGEWLGPDLDELIDAAAASEVTGVVVVPIGFVTDHMETLYDLDIVAADRALLADLEFMRGPVPNDDDTVIGAVADAVAKLV